MTIKTNGGVTSGEALTGNMDFFTINTVIAIQEGDFGSTDSAKRNLIKFAEAISMGAQPVLVAVSSAVVDLTVAGNRTLYGLGTGFNQAATTIYTLKFAVEHSEVFGTTALAAGTTAAYTLASRLKGLKMPFATASVPGAGGDITAVDVDGAATKNTAITAFNVL